MGCCLRSSYVSRRRNDVVLDMRQYEYEIQSDQYNRHQVGNVRDKLIKTIRRHLETNWRRIGAMNGICSEKTAGVEA